MAAYTQVPLRLFLAQLAWLEAALSRFKLSNSSNAFRCCVNCVAVGDAAQLRNDDDADGETGYQADFVVDQSREQLHWLRELTKIGREDGHDEEDRAILHGDGRIYGVRHCQMQEFGRRLCGG